MQMVYAFKTDDGSQGLMRVTLLPEGGARVAIKHVQQASAEDKPAPQVAAPAPPPARTAPARPPRSASTRPAAQAADGSGTGGPSGTVRLPDGKPAADVTVLLVRPNPNGVDALVIEDGEIGKAHQSLRTQTDAQGKFSFAPHDGAFKLVAIGPQGFAWVKGDRPKHYTIRMEAWARVQGKLQIRDQENAEREIVAISSVDAVAGGITIESNCEAITDKDGGFVFEHIPPGEVMVGLKVQHKRGKSGVGQFDHTQTFKARAAKTERITLGGTGRPVSGEIITDAATMDVAPRDLFIYGSLHRLPQNTFFGLGAVTNIGTTNIAFHVQPDGSFRASDVPPGEYELDVWAYRTHPDRDWGTQDLFGRVRQKVRVPARSDNVGWHLGVFTIQNGPEK
jgi:hypothetical protein